MLNYQAIERISSRKEFQQLTLLEGVDMEILKTNVVGPLRKYFTADVHSHS